MRGNEKPELDIPDCAGQLIPAPQNRANQLELGVDPLVRRHFVSTVTGTAQSQEVWNWLKQALRLDKFLFFESVEIYS